jgi:hypothetical protein
MLHALLTSNFCGAFCFRNLPLPFRDTHPALILDCYYAQNAIGLRSQYLALRIKE